MALATVEQIRDRVVNEKDKYKKRNLLEQMYCIMYPEVGFSWPPKYPDKLRYNAAMAEALLEKTKRDWETHQLGKGIRPWNIAKVTQDLPADGVWIGMEYETGFRNAQAYAIGVNELWNNHNNVAMDGEGYGSHYAEITFSPVTLDTFMTSDYNIDRLMAADAEQSLLLPYNRSYGQWGMHVNFSTPAIRKDDVLAASYAIVLSNSLYNMTIADRNECFGRDPYGEFEHRADSDDDFNWIEGKLFETTTDPVMWARYKKVIKNMIIVVQRIEDQVNGLAEKDHCIKNFAELLLADDPNDLETETGAYASNGTPEWGDSDDYGSDYEEDYDECCSCLSCREARGEL